MINKSTARLSKELDLQKFLHRQRVLVVTLLGLLTGRQKNFVDSFSQLVIRESDDMEETSEDDVLVDLGKKNMDFVDQMKASGNEVDQRLLAIFNLRENQRAPETQEAEIVEMPADDTLLLSDINNSIQKDNSTDELARSPR